MTENKRFERSSAKARYLANILPYQWKISLSLDKIKAIY